jgi:hypothetical protein
VIALALGTQFPDLVDKPLSWSLGLLPSGHSLAHSVFVALPTSALAVTVAWVLGWRRVGAAFALGYLSHLPADVFYPALVGGEPNYGVFLWPVVSTPVSETSVGFMVMFRTLLGRYVTELMRGELSTYFALEIGLLAAVVLLWLLDGAPPLKSVWSRVVVGRPTDAEETP